jgi:hypothetical protein
MSRLSIAAVLLAVLSPLAGASGNESANYDIRDDTR